MKNLIGWIGWEDLSGFRLADPWLLLALLAIPILLWVRHVQTKKLLASLRYSDLGMLRGTGRTWASRLSWLPSALRVAALVLLVVAFARPQAGHAEEEMLTRGLDIILALDNSTSMAAEDFRPKNRLGVAKESLAAFVEGRRTDRIGLVVFAGRGATRCPLTLDYDVLLELLSAVRMAERDEGTAIGMGLALALNRLRDSDAQSKVVVLLTDGRNNRGEIDPTTSAALAKTLGIRIYTIGVGTRGEAPYPVNDPVLGKRYLYLRADLDEDVLKSIAETTGGKYFRATDRESLQGVFQAIDSLEKSDVKVRHYMRWSELFPWLAWPGVGLFLVEIVLSHGRLRRLP